MTELERNAFLTADDDVLLRGCEFIMQKGTGNGGQKINKTSSAVRIRHSATGIAVSANEERSQARNRHIALQKLRFEIAVRIHASPDAPFEFTPLPSPSNHLRLVLWTAAVFDRLAAAGWDLAKTAEQCGVSASRLEHAMRKIPPVWRCFSEQKNAASD